MKNMMKKFLSVVLVLSLLGVSQMGIPFAFDAEAATHTGECGTALVWSLDTLTGVLEISGTGDMDNWTTSDYPSWRSYKSSIRTVNITNGVTSIGDYAFYNYDSLSVVNIPASVTSIAEFAFNDCDNLKSITVDENNTYYSSDENGVLFNEGKTELIQYPANNTNTSYQIPDTVKILKTYAFKNCDKLESVSVPASVTDIGIGAFYDCDALSTVNIPNSVKTIGDDAFYSCDSIESVIVPASVTSIGTGAFFNCSSLSFITVDESNTKYSNDENGVLFNKDKTELIQYPVASEAVSYQIPDSVTKICANAFRFSDNITSVTIPASVATIGELAFSDCNSLAAITVDAGNTNYSSDERGVLFDKSKKLLIRYPAGNTGTSYSVPEGVTTIGDSAFYQCTALATVVIPDSVTLISDKAFWGCTGIKDLTMPAAARIFNSALTFSGCTKIEKITLTKGNGTLRNYSDSTVKTDTYYKYTPWYLSRNSVKEIIISEGVIRIGALMFNECKGVASVTIPTTIKNIGKKAFNDCESLTDVYYDNCDTYWKAITVDTYNSSLTSAKIHFRPHEYESSVTTDPTCTETGVRTYKCDCGYSYTEAISVIPHTPGEWETVTPATCSKEGEKVQKCAVCKEVIATETIGKLGHTPGEWEIAVHPTESETGLKVKKCTVCGEILEEAVIPTVSFSLRIKGNPVRVFYKESATVEIVSRSIPENAKINWTVTSGKADISASTDTRSCNIKFTKFGQVKITATVEGTDISDTITVKVRYTWWQWIIVILLFGWIWY